MQGKLPVKLISPIVLKNILRNVTLTLPEGYELIVGVNSDSIHLYYDLVVIAIVANVHRVHLVFNIPLKPANRHFTRFEMITLTVRISSDIFAKYLLNFKYFGIKQSTGLRIANRN
jgi:hypothetical protein